MHGSTLLKALVAIIITLLVLMVVVNGVLIPRVPHVDTNREIIELTHTIKEMQLVLKGQQSLVGALTAEQTLCTKTITQQYNLISTLSSQQAQSESQLRTLHDTLEDQYGLLKVLMRKVEEQLQITYMNPMPSSSSGVMSQDIQRALQQVHQEQQFRSPVNVFIDCGANQGDTIAQFTGLSNTHLHTWQSDAMFGYAKNRSGGWDVYSFEGNPLFNEQLTTLAGQIRTLPPSAGGPFRVFMYNQTAVGGRSGSVEFFLDSKSGVHWGSSLLDTHPDVNVSKEGTKIKVPMVDIVEILFKYRINDYVVLKVDVEGAEYEIMRNIFARGALPLVDELYLEFHDLQGYEHKSSIQWIIQQAPGLKVGDWF